LGDEYDGELDIRHWSFDKKEGKKKDRGPFKYRTLKEGLLLPERQFFVQLVKFAPGKGPKDFFEFHIHLDEKLKRMYKGKTRCEGMKIHEIVSFVTWGLYDMVVLWDAPSMATANEFLAAWVDSGDYGTSTTLPVGIVYMHPWGG
jgi:uncharacterized protein with GYD domain